MHDQGFNNLEILKIGCMISLGPAYLGIPKCDELKRPTHPTLDMKTSRRKFINKASAAFAGVQFLPSHVWANSPNGKLNLVQIGCGGKGAGDLAQMRSHPKVHIAALCDIDSKILDGVKRKNPDARAFDDYRELFAAMGNKIDGVVVSTPDHTHAPASMLALNLGKHVYCQKPLTHDVYEARQVRLIAEKKGMVTQMGIQIHASKDYRSATQLIQSGVIGKVHHVHAWSNKTWGYDGGPIVGEDPVPENVNWDAWVGTAAMRSYKKGTYHRSQWRKLLDFGCGTLGDMGVHIFDTPFRALELSVPLKVKTTCRKPTGVGHPSKNVVEYEFSGTKHTTEKMIWKWYDGRYAPPKDIKIGDKKLPAQGSLFIGEKGQMLLPHIGPPQFFDTSGVPQKMQLPDLEQINHYHQWVDAALGKDKASANFSYAGRLTEAMLLGVVAGRFPDQELLWDEPTMKFTNLSEANKFLRRSYRQGFEVENL